MPTPDLLPIPLSPKDIAVADFDAYIRDEIARLAPLLRTITADR
jgi:hypothetical protein